MFILEYYSLEIQITKEPEGYNKYRASILENGNIKATRSFELKHDLKISQMLDRIEEKVIISHPQPEETTHIELGRMLYNSVFSGELGDYFSKRLNESQKKNCGLRVVMQFAENIPEIAALPWEYLHNGEDFLVTKRNLLFSRLPLGMNKTEFQPLGSILRMLVVISNPDDPKIPPFNIEKEQEIILEALDTLQKDQKIKVDFTEDATFENVQGYLNEQNYHIVHFTGHGAFKYGKSHLVFETEDQKARLIDNKTLSDLFSERGIRLVVLSSCESAKGSNKETFGDLASMLSIKGIPAVVGMQYSVLDDVATKFAYTFYRTIVTGKSVDVALNEARIAMKDSEKSNGFDFAIPVLYLSDPMCVHVGKLKPEPSEFIFKPMMLPDLQVMEKGFVARRKELRILENGFKSDVKRAAIIHGFGGIGKTVLATRFALKMGYYFEGTLGIKCTSTTRPEDILNKFNSFLLMKGRPELNQILNQQIPLEVKTTLLVNILNQIRFLVIFDNFEDCLNEERNDIENPELKAFIQHLLNNTTRNTKFLITTRYDFDPLEGRLASGIEHISLPELRFPQTNWLMNNFTELADLGIQKKKEIYDVIGGHPWTIGQFAKHAAVQGVDDLLLDLSSLKKEFIEFTLLDESFSKLDEDAKKMLLCASIYEEAVPVEALSWIVGDEKNESPSVGISLQKLLQWGLISKEQEYDKSVYSEHTIVKDFARKKLEKDGLDKKEFLIRAARYYESLVSQTGNLWDYLKARDYYFHAGDWESANEVVENTSSLLIRWGYIKLAMSLLNESIGTTSGVQKINAAYTLATIYYLLGDFNTALKMYNDIKYKFDEVGDKNGIAITLYQLGMIYQDQGNYEEAVRLYKQSLEIYEELENKGIIASILMQLGTIHQDQGNYEEAVRLYKQSLKTFKEHGDISGVAKSLHQLGVIHQDQGNYEEAVKLYEQSLQIEEKLGDKSGIAVSLHQLGNIYTLKGSYEKAVKLYNRSLKIAEELGNKSGIAGTLHQLGNIHYTQGNYEEAVNMYSQSLNTFKELRDLSGIANSLHQLGMIYQDQGNYREALNFYKQSLKIENDLGDKSGIGSTLHQLGNAYYLQDNYEKALECYEGSLKIKKELTDNLSIAQVIYRLGELHLKMKNYDFAVNYFRESSTIFKKMNDFRGVAQSCEKAGESLIYLGRLNKAYNALIQSKEYYIILNDKKGFARVLVSLAKIEQDTNNLEKARWTYKDALDHLRELDPKNYALVSISLSQLELQTGLVKDAILRLNQIEEYFAKSNDYENLKKIKRLLKISYSLELKQKEGENWAKGLFGVRK